MFRSSELSPGDAFTLAYDAAHTTVKGRPVRRHMLAVSPSEEPDLTYRLASIGYQFVPKTEDMWSLPSGMHIAGELVGIGAQLSYHVVQEALVPAYSANGFSEINIDASDLSVGGNDGTIREKLSIERSLWLGDDRPDYYSLAALGMAAQILKSINNYKKRQ